jgi:hypothetical protein
MQQAVYQPVFCGGEQECDRKGTMQMPLGLEGKYNVSLRRFY